jgi:DNA-binding LacI/PurR family transcriptional regulator
VPSIGNPFYAELAEAMERITYTAGFRIFITNTYRNEKLGQELLDDLMSRRVDGIITVSEGISLRALQSLQPLATSQLPVIYCLWEEVEPEGAPSVNFDFRMAGRLVAEHLLNLGHRRIGVVTDGVSSDGRAFEKIRHHKRVSGFQEILEQSGYPLAPSLLAIADSSFPSGKMVAHLLLQQPEVPTAIFATNDLMALAVISAASELGIQVPRDLSVVGLDNIGLASYNVPPLTTIALDKDLVAKQALAIVFQMLEGKEVSSYPLLEPELIVRGSTAPPREMKP